MNHPVSGISTAQPALRAAISLLLFMLAIGESAEAQLFTMNEECRNSVAEAEGLAASGDYSRALDLYSSLVEECDSRDGVEAVQVGIARAQNGLRNYDEAIAAANVALEETKQEGLNALFERARAEESLGNMAAAQADYDRMIELTEMNQNVAERATLYAKVANMNYRAGKPAEAEQYLATAMELDPGNPGPYILRGDWAINDGDYEKGFDDYDRAVELGRTDAEMYGIRSDARIGMLQEKYGTENVQELRAQMTPGEKDLVCADSKKALDLGLRDMQMDMFVALVCR